MKILLTANFDENNSHREQLLSVLQRAGMDLIDGNLTSLAEMNTAIREANCSVHILSRDYGKTLEDNNKVSFSKHQFSEARKKLLANPNTYKMFIWYPPDVLSAQKEPLQEEFINEIRNSITKNMVFTTIASPIQLVDDIRSLLEAKEQVTFDINSTDIFLVSNQLDENEANEIIDMLSDIVPVEKLNIIQDSDVDYSELCKQQISKSKLAVIYFKESAEWALPFAQQVWKKIGGATSHTPILLIGDDDPETNLNKKFNAPKVISLIVSGQLIPLEIKVQYDKVVEAK